MKLNDWKLPIISSAVPASSTDLQQAAAQLRQEQLAAQAMASYPQYTSLWTTGYGSCDMVKPSGPKTFEDIVKEEIEKLKRG